MTNIAVAVSATPLIASIFRAMRVSHWAKNALILIPLFSLSFWEGSAVSVLSAVIDMVLAFVSVSLFSSACYLINDILDVNSDRAHPVKKFRPLSSGLMGKAQYKALSLILMVLAIAFSCSNIHTQYFLASYFLLFVFYNYFAKRVMYLDIITLSSFYLLRATLGIAISGIHFEINTLLLLMSATVALGAMKRKTEFIISKNFRFSDQRDHFSKGIYTITSASFCITLTALFLILSSSTTNISNVLFDLSMKIIAFTISILLIFAIFISKYNTDDISNEVFSSKSILINLFLLVVAMANL